MNSKNQIIILIAFICVIIAFHLFGYTGHFAYDDLHYAKLAVDFNNGIIDYTDHFSFRTTILLFTSLSYYIFGISDFSSSLPAILIAISIICIVYSILKNRGPVTTLFGLSLTVFSYWFIFYSDKLMVDIYIALSVLATFYVIHLYKFSRNRKNTLLYSILLSLALLFGFMAKGTIVLIIPVLMFNAIIDLWLKRDIKFWVYSLISGSVIFILYLFVIWLITGDLLKRFDSIAGNGYLNLCSYDQQPLLILLKRVSYEFFKMLTFQSMATGFIFVIPYLIGKKSSGFFKMKDSFSFWTTSSLVLLLSSNFMTISFTSYSPMCLDPRHYLFLIPVVSVPASIIMNDFFERRSAWIQIIFVVSLIALLSIFFEGNSFLHLYLPLSVLLLTYSFVKINKTNTIIFSVLFVIILMIKPLVLINYAQKVNYWKQREMFQKYILDANSSCVVVTNNVSQRLAEYYNAFNEDNNYSFYNYNNFQYDSTDSRVKYLFLNWFTRYLSNLNYQDLPYYVDAIAHSDNLVYEDKEINLAVYEMKDSIMTNIQENTLLHTINDFENDMDHWNQNNNHLTSEIKYEGNTSIQVFEYSPAFEYFIDSLDIEDFSQIILSCKMYCNFSDKTDAKLVISIGDKEGDYIWQGTEVNKFLKAYSNWWLVQDEMIIDTKQLKNNSRIKIFLWNIDQQIAFIDNFEIKVVGINK